MTQQSALDILKLGYNVYLTGSAGSGKTYLLNQYIAYLREHGVDVAVTASTGIAASHMNGVTIHSWSGLGVRHTLSEYDLEGMEEKRYLWDRFQKTKVLIIDEVSMLHHYRLDLIDRIARFFKRNNAPFGGMQVILCGDFFQLPPVARNGEPDAHFIYHSDAWKNLDLKVCYLTESHRHNDPAFISVLNAIRGNTMSNETVNHLLARLNKEPESLVKPTKLYTHNIDVDAINAAELEKVEGDLHTHRMSDQGIEALTLALKSSCLAPATLHLKKGAQVMFVKNNYEAGYVNGTLGVVLSSAPQCVVVHTAQGKIINAVPQDWMIEEDGKVKAKITQMPLRLAWAITIHKSQGMTLDAAEIDLSKAFEKGMGYVALSRVKALSGLKLVGINDRALEVSEEVLMFDEELQKQSAASETWLASLNPKVKEKAQFEFLASVAPHGKVKKVKRDASGKKVSTFEQTRAMVAEGVVFKEIVEKRGLKAETIIDHIEQLLEEEKLSAADIAYIKDEELKPARFKKIAAAFAKSTGKNQDFWLSPIKKMLPDDYSFAEIRLARLFLKK